MKLYLKIKLLFNSFFVLKICECGDFLKIILNTFTKYLHNFLLFKINF